MLTDSRVRAFASVAAILLILRPAVGIAEPRPPEQYVPRWAYADLVDLADSAELVLRAKVRKMIRVEDARSPGLKPGHGRFYVQAETVALVTGTSGLGESLAYLVDLPLDSSGKPPKLKKLDVLLFARSVPGRPGELQLVAPDAQLVWDVASEGRVRTVLGELIDPDAPGVVSGVREIIHVPGTLAGEGETQIFLATSDGSPASITVSHRAGLPPAWGASFTELVANVGSPPVRDTLEWYRLACFLPNSVPNNANHSESPASRSQALADYRFVLGDLGVCERKRR